MLTEQEIAASLLQVLDATNFPGSSRKQVTQIAEWLEEIAKGARVTSYPQPQNARHMTRFAQE